MSKQNPQIVSPNEFQDYSDEDDDLFMNLAPVVSQKKSLQYNANNQQHSILAKMKRLMGNAYMTKTIDECIKKPTKTQKVKTKKNSNVNTFYPQQSDSQVQDRDSNISKEVRERSRDKDHTKKSSQSISKVSQQIVHDTAILSIQKQTRKQNMKQTINQLVDDKVGQKVNFHLSKFAEIQKQLLIPINELPFIPKRTLEEQKKEKNAKKRLDRLMVKKHKQYKLGKVRDEASNCVFNGIEDYFM